MLGADASTTGSLCDYDVELRKGKNAARAIDTMVASGRSCQRGSRVSAEELPGV